MRPRIEPLDDRSGVEILDPVENHRFLLYTPEDVSPTGADTGAFTYPVTVARRVVASGLSLAYRVPVMVRHASDGSHILDVGSDGTYEFEADDYLIEMSAPVKIYVRVESSLTVNATTDRIDIEFDDETPLEVSARSSHTSPAATVTVSDDSRDLMAAVSTFGSALKTTTCERSWPSLRGHPPRIERGDDLSIPDGIDAPDTGVTLHVPAEYDYVYPVAPLAYYLGAEVVPAETPRLTTDAGFTRRLDVEPGFEEEVIDVLQRTFLLDCVTRTEGYHPMDLHERRVIESTTDLDFADLYDAPVGEQLAAYHSVPDEAVAEAMMTWNRVTHVRPSADAAELLPYVVNDLSLVRIESPVTDSASSSDDPRTRAQDAVSSFKRGTRAGGDEDVDGRVEDAVEQDHATGERATGVPAANEYVPLPETDAAERAWAGEGTPVHGAKLITAAFEHDRPEPTDGVIDVTVVCNDAEMREEWDAVSEVYGTRDVVPFDVDCRFGVRTDELRDLLARDHDLFHFIGHIDGRGFECPDGVMDAETIPETGATTILLNACRSHDQGVALVEAGARAAIVSWGDVDNLGAVDVGETFARLFNYGFGVGSALEIVEEHTAIGRHYLVVGDPGVSVAQCEDGNPWTYELDWDPSTPPDHDDELDTTIVSYDVRRHPIGSVSEPYLRGPDDPDFYLVPGELETFTSSGEKLRDIFTSYSAPVVVGDELLWTDEWLGDDST